MLAISFNKSYNGKISEIEDMKECNYAEKG